MIQVLTGDLLQSQAQTLVNTVNCVGVMGKGIALEFKRRFPEMLKDYVARCERKEVRLGEPYLYRYLTPPWVLNFPTKDHWRSVARLEDIVEGLEYLSEHYEEWGITSLAVPPLGCGNGQLEWRVVGPTLYRHLKRIDVPIELYAPHGTLHEELQPSFLDEDPRLEESFHAIPEPQWIPPAWVALVEVLRRIEDQPYHWPVGRTIFQKIAYVATMQGLPTDLQFERGSYGPFAPRFKQVETRLVNNGLLSEQRRGRMLEIRVGPTFQDAAKAYQEDLELWDPIVDRTFDLFMRIRTTDQAELVSAALFSAERLVETNDETSERMVFDSVLEWKKRRRQPFDAGEVASTVRSLAARGWLEVAPSSDLPLPEEALLY